MRKKLWPPNRCQDLIPMRKSAPRRIGWWSGRNSFTTRRAIPDFAVVYTDIPKILRGYYETVDGKSVENLERGRSNTIRPDNVWVDIQQVFYRMEENVRGAYAQKPLKAIERIIATCSHEADLVVDLFAHSGTTLIACERLGRVCYTSDIDPIFAEITIQRLEHFRETRKTGFQYHDPFKERETCGRQKNGVSPIKEENIYK